jgi:hypothetical protein
LREAILGSYSETGKRAYEGIGSHQPGSNFSDYQDQRKAVFNDPKIFQIGTKVESARVAAPELTKPVTTTGTVVGADGSRYSIVSDEVADGDCGLNAVNQVLCTSDDSRARAAFDRAKSQLGYEVNECMKAHYSVTSALNTGSTASGNQIATDLSVMFGGKYENFKAFVQSKSKTYLHHLAITEAPSTTEKEARMQRAETAVAEFNEAVNSATSFTELGSKSRFNEIWNSNLAVKDYFSSYSHNDREVNHDQGSVYVARAHTHLTSDQISGLMLAKGYYLYDTGVHDSPAPGQTHSVLKFKHLTTNEEACIACTGRHGNVPTLADHWVHVKKSG